MIFPVLVSYLHDLLISLQADFDFRYNHEIRLCRLSTFPSSDSGRPAMNWRSWMKLLQGINVVAIVTKHNSETV